MDSLNIQNPHTLETTNHLTRHYKRVRIGDRSHRNLLSFPVMRTSNVPDNHFRSEKIVDHLSTEKKTDDNNVKELRPQALLMPPPPVGYLKPRKYDYF